MTLIWSNTNPNVVFKFTPKADISAWRIVNDGVMGGLSSSTIELTEEGKGLFKGTISLENYGGFASVRHRFETCSVRPYKGFRIRLKGDGKRYQFRVKESSNDAHSYMTYIQTSTDWEVYDLKFEDLYPTFRGRRLSIPNFKGDDMEQIGFLIANKKAENFRLEIERIVLY